ncbi:fimbrial protein [Scandinavium sp. NPDC088450]|uniref:fimbrial protein n=1 Tax=Scandinavium sp. NPDC088450 TaxID=3364514 RepID=UPI00384B21CD
MNTRLLTLALSCFLLGFTLDAAGDDTDIANLVISGTILPQTCDVESGSQNQTVTIGDFAAKDFPSVGSVTTAKDFPINLTGCTAGIEGAKITFTGTADTTDPTLLALSDTEGNGTLATGIGVQIIDANQQPISINNADSTVYPLTEGDNQLNFALRYKSTAATVTSGDATAVMYFDLSYQ